MSRVFFSRHTDGDPETIGAVGLLEKKFLTFFGFEFCFN